MSRVCRRAAAAIALAGLALAALAGDASAGPAGRLVTSGRCPGRGHMEAALAGVVDIDAGGAWTIAIAPDRGGARLTLRDGRGEVALERRLESRDCSAMARAFAVILHAFFRQLAVRGESASLEATAERRRGSPAVDGGARRPRTGTARVGEAAREPRGEEAREPRVAAPPPGVREPTPVADRAGSAPDADTAGATPRARPPGPAPVLERSGPLPTVEADTPTSVARPAEPSPARRVAVRAEADGPVDRRVDPPTVSARVASPGDGGGPGPGIDLAFSAGGAVSATTDASAFGSLEVGWRFGRRASARLEASTATPTVQGEGGADRVQLQESALVAGVGYQVGGHAWVRPAVLAGAAAWRVDPLDIEGATRLRVQPIATAAVASGVRISRALSVRAEVGLTTYVRTDRFFVLRTGEIARSPRTALAISVGIEWASFH